MPISDQGDYPKGHFTKVYNQIFKPAIIAAGYEPFRVDEDKISNPIINKIFDAVQNCTMALCDLSNRNPNVLYELGLRQAYDKPVVLVQDEKTPRIFDVSGINTVQYSSERLFENVMEAREKITEGTCIESSSYTVVPAAEIAISAFSIRVFISVVFKWKKKLLSPINSSINFSGFLNNFPMTICFSTSLNNTFFFQYRHNSTTTP